MHELIKRGTALSRSHAAMLIVAWGLMVVASTNSRAQKPAGNDWIGKRVVQKYPKFTLKIENQAVDLKRISVYDVVQVKGLSLGLMDSHVIGWAPADQVIPLEEAIDFFTNSIRSNPRDAHAFVMRAKVLALLNNEFDRALADFKEAIRLNPTGAWIYANRAVVWLGKTEYDKAIADYNEATRLSPNDADAYFGRAVIWLQKNERDNAVADFNQAIRLDPNDAPMYYYRASVLMGMNELDKAIADFSQAIRLKPRFADAYRNRGSVWCAKGGYEKAIADFNEAIRLNPKDADAYFGRGTVWSDTQEFDKAIAEYDQVIKLDPKHTLSYYLRGRAWTAKNEFDKAIADFSEAVRLNPENADVLRDRGSVWSAKKQYDKAIADFNEAIRLNPKDALAYTLRAWIAATCPDAKYRDGKMAVEFATTACELSEWKDPNHLDGLAAAYAESSDFDSAVKCQTKAIELLGDEQTKEVYRSRLKLYQEKKPYREGGVTAPF